MIPGIRHRALEVYYYYYYYYYYSLYNGISQANLNKIQRIQNTLARIVTNTSKFEHIVQVPAVWIDTDEQTYAEQLQLSLCPPTIQKSSRPCVENTGTVDP